MNLIFAAVFSAVAFTAKGAFNLAGLAFGALFRAAPGALAGFVNATEIVNAFLAAHLAGFVVGGAIALLESMQASVSAIFPNPVVGGLMTVVLTSILALVHKLGQEAGLPAIASSRPLGHRLDPASLRPVHCDDESNNLATIGPVS